MAGDWIKFGHTTPDKPEVVQIASALRLDQDAVVGKLLRVWIWADQNSISGETCAVTDAFIDRLTSKKGFAAAMRKVGWLLGEEGALSFSNFERNNGETAKARAETNRRVSDMREKRKCNVEPVTNVTPDPLQKPLPEKRREEKNTEEEEQTAASPMPLPFESHEFRSAWELFTKHRSEIRKPLKPTSTEMALKQLAAMGEQRAIRCIEHTVAKGWQGLREPDAQTPSLVPMTRPQQQPVNEPDGWRSFINHNFPESRFSAGQPDEAHQWSDLDRQTQLWLIGQMRRSA